MYTEELEARLNNEIEQPFNAVLDHLDQHSSLRAQDIPAICRYVVALIRRVPQGRERSRQAFPGVAERVEHEHLQRIDQLEAKMQALVPGPAPLAESARANIRRIHQSLRGQDADWLWHDTVDPERFPRLLALLNQMTWFARSAPSGRQLLIGDNPVLFDEFRGLRERPELVLPIRHDMLLHGFVVDGRINVGRIPHLSTQLVRRVNENTVMRAQRWLFFSRNEAWIPEFVRKHSGAR